MINSVYGSLPEAFSEEKPSGSSPGIVGTGPSPASAPTYEPGAIFLTRKSRDFPWEQTPFHRSGTGVF